MLSILIPTYNYDISKLLRVLHQQATVANIAFEILAKDDASSKHIDTNITTTKELGNAHFFTAKENIGRTASRQFLAKRAKI